jgi:PQQ-dependent dehydrogenase (methanol/ethanol family)
MMVSRLLLGFVVLAAFCSAQADIRSSPAALIEEGRKQFGNHCAGCHGGDGLGGERAPSVAQPESRWLKSAETIRELLKTGIPDAGMPSFQLIETETRAIVAFVQSLVTPAAEAHPAGDPAAGERFFFGAGNCSSCHMARGRGALTGPDLTEIARKQTLAEIESALVKPKTMRGYSVVGVKLVNGTELRGFARNRSTFDIQIQGFDGQLYLLKREEIAALTEEEKPLMPALSATETEKQNLLAYLANLGGGAFQGTATADDAAALRVAFEDIIHPAEGDWPSYHGNLSGNRYSQLNQINKSNIHRLALKWTFRVGGTENLEVTPVVVKGVMYVTTANQCLAIDARSGRQIWLYQRPLTKGVIGDAAGAINRGVAVLGDRLFMVTDNAHLIALERTTGALLWDVEMADYKQHYGATSAPLVAGDLVISGTSGGDEGIRGFVAAYAASTGKEVWRFWTVPAPGEPLSETWRGRAIEHPCVATWLTGTYDAETKLLFWTTGNPCPDYNGDERQGDNLYANSVLALHQETGKLAWYFQYTPHDLHDWDAAQTALVADAVFRGEARRLLLQGNRNGYFYVLDRKNGKFLVAYPFVKLLTWADGIDGNGRPKVKPNTEPTLDGTKVCPAVEGATNWMSSAFSPQTGLFYLMALEKCNVYTKSSAWWRPGESFYGGDTRGVPEIKPKKFLRAIDIQTGEITWEIPQDGLGHTWGGLMATASGLLFFCEDSGSFAAADATTGEILWHFQANQGWHASPMTFAVDGSEYVSIAAGSNILVFGLN